MTDNNVTICGHGSGTPRLANLRQYADNRYKQIASNGVHKGIVTIRRLKAFKDANAAQYRAAYQIILGRNIYHQGLRQYVYVSYNGKYYSDCSSSQMAALARATGSSLVLLNTAGIYNSDLFVTVPVVIKDGHIKNPEVLRVGDQILFAGNDPSRPRQIGHVEGVYAITKDAQQPLKPAVQNAKYRDNSLAGKYIVKAGGLNLRYGAGTQFESIMILSKGQYVRNFGYYNVHDGKKWLYVVTDDGTVGYACIGQNGQYLSRV